MSACFSSFCFLTFSLTGKEARKKKDRKERKEEEARRSKEEGSMKEWVHWHLLGIGIAESMAE